MVSYLINSRLLVLPAFAQAVLNGIDTKLSAPVLLCVLAKCFQEVWTPSSTVSHEEISQRLLQLAFSNTEDDILSWEGPLADISCPRHC